MDSQDVILDLGKLIRLTHVVAATAATTQDTELDENTVTKLTDTFSRIRAELNTAVRSDVLEELDRAVLGDITALNGKMVHATHVQAYAWLRGLREAAQSAAPEPARDPNSALTGRPGTQPAAPGGYL